MENAADALVMAGHVLIFILALTLWISSFSDLRVAVDESISHTDVIKLAKDSSFDVYINYVQSKENESTRIVGAETVVSSMYRSIKEDFEMYLLLNPTTFSSIRYTIDDYNDKIQKASLSSFFKIDYYDYNGKKAIKMTISGEKSNAIPDTILKTGFYEVINDKEFYEYLGEYQENVNEAVSTENRQTRRIITYIEK